MNTVNEKYQMATLEVGRLYWGEIRFFFKKMQLKGYDVEFIESDGIVDKEFTYRAKPDDMAILRRYFNDWIKRLDEIDRQEELEKAMKALEKSIRKGNSWSSKLGKKIEDLFQVIKGEKSLSEIYTPKTSHYNEIAHPNGDTLMHLFCRHDGFEDIEIALPNGGDPNCKNNHGETPLMIAVDRENGEIIKQLLDFGADPECKDNQGVSAMDRAERLNSEKPWLKDIFDAHLRSIGNGMH